MIVRTLPCPRLRLAVRIGTLKGRLRAHSATRRALAKAENALRHPRFRLEPHGETARAAMLAASAAAARGSSHHLGLVRACGEELNEVLARQAWIDRWRDRPPWMKLGRQRSAVRVLDRFLRDVDGGRVAAGDGMRAAAQKRFLHEVDRLAQLEAILLATTRSA